jgi:arylsulfatase A-like enzyme
VRYIDAEFGRIVDACRRGGLEKNTILIFTADHGEDLGERNFFFEHGTLTFTAGARVPMLVRIPGIKARKTKIPVSVMDVYPTVLECLGLKAPYELQGVSLLRPQQDRLLYIAGIGSQAVVRNDWHYIGLSPKTAKRLGLAPNHFHDLIADPRETSNRFSDKAAQALVLAGKYAAFLKQHGYFTKPGTKSARKKIGAEEKKSLETLGYL